jgi:hypothetical protein
MDVRGVQVHCGETQEGNKSNKKGEKAGVGKGTGRLMMALVARLIDGWCKLFIAARLLTLLDNHRRSLKSEEDSRNAGKI